MSEHQNGQVNIFQAVISSQKIQGYFLKGVNRNSGKNFVQKPTEIWSKL